MELDKLKQLTDKLNDRDRERDLLVRELQFRLKDSLQTVTSLLALVARNTDNDAAAEVLNSTIYRVQTLALVYSLTCKSDDIAKVSIRNIVDRILSNAVQLVPCPKYNIDVDVEDMYLPVHAAMPTAQILGEMLINSLRHAVRVDSRVHVVVNNSGISVTPCGLNGHDKIGMHLITILTEQLDGTITRDNEMLNANIDLYSISEVNYGTNTDC